MSSPAADGASYGDPEPILADGVLRRGRAFVVLSHAEERLMELLLESGSAVVSRADAARRTGYETADEARAFDSLVSRLRRKLLGTGMSIRSERRRGLALELSGSGKRRGAGAGYRG